MAEADGYGIAAGRGLSLEPLCPTMRNNQEPALRSRVLERGSHERVDQVFQNDLARDRLRDLDDGREIQVLDLGRDRSCRRGR